MNEQNVSNVNRQFELLNREIQSCQKCRLAETRTHALVGEGNRDAILMLIAQAPGDMEDRENRLFIGPSGAILDSLLTDAGVSRDSIFITNLLKCRLPRCRRPKLDEIEDCSDFLLREIAIINPKVLVPLGYYATRYFIQKYEIPYPDPRSEVPDLFGQKIIVDGRLIYPLPHPASLIYNENYWPLTQEQYRKLKVLG